MILSGYVRADAVRDDVVPAMALGWAHSRAHRREGRDARPRNAELCAWYRCNSGGMGMIKGSGVSLTLWMWCTGT